MDTLGTNRSYGKTPCVTLASNTLADCSQAQPILNML